MLGLPEIGSLVHVVRPLSIRGSAGALADEDGRWSQDLFDIPFGHRVGTVVEISPFGFVTYIDNGRVAWRVHCSRLRYSLAQLRGSHGTPT